MFPGIGMPELMVVMLVILLLFGSKRIPDLAKSVGKSMREFKKAADDVKKEIDLSDHTK